jgi:hypothetical protein
VISRGTPIVDRGTEHEGPDDLIPCGMAGRDVLCAWNVVAG